MIAHLVFGAASMAAIVLLIALDAPIWLTILSMVLLWGVFAWFVRKSRSP